jgi:hypothetical protein
MASDQGGREVPDTTFPREAHEITPDWLSAILGGSVETVEHEQIGIGVGLLGRLYRLALTGKGVPSSIILKLPTLDTGARQNVVEPLRFYEKEIAFYNEAAHQMPVSTATVYHAEFDKASNDFCLLLEDLGTRRMEDQIAGCPIEDAEKAIDALAHLHSHWWNSSAFPSWLPLYSDPPYPQVIQGMYLQAWPKAVEVFGDHLSPKFKEYGERYPSLVPFFMENLGHEPFTLCHGDFRLDNLFFGTDASHPEITVVDWQICFKGRGGYDVGYFISQSLQTDVRRANEDRLKERYLEGLAKRGVTYDHDEFLDDYRRTVAYCFIYAVVSAGQIEATNERMVELILSILDRAVVAIEDNKALEVLPS